ncbi:MAG: tetratricopeptide repeat protein [Candidatus Obscuribacterales bacterium]|nr:tetratricopeptide repeat protein [Candidatus Obscuribacterales bacterium]
MRLKKLSLSITMLVGACISALPVFADSHGNFPGKGDEEAWKRSCAPIHNSNILYKQGDYQGAIKLDKEAISIYPYDSAIYHNLGNALAKLGKLDEARQAQEQALELEPKFVGAWISLGVTYEKQRCLADAERCYRKAVQVEPCYEALGDLGDILRQQGKFDEAMQIMLRAKACPENARYPGQADKFIDMCRQHRKEASN